MQMLSEKQILDKRQYGDHSLVAQMLTSEKGKYISANYVAQILRRPESSLYTQAVNALRKVVEARESLLEPQS